MTGARAWDALRDAYAAAWSLRDRTGGFDPGLLEEVLRQRGLDTWIQRGPLRDTLFDLWHEGVRPDGLRSALMVAFSKEVPSAVGAVARAYWEIFKTLRGGEWLPADESWLKMPPGHRALSRVRQANDIVLRYFHRPVELIDLDLHADPAGDDVLARVQEVPPVEWSPDQPDLRRLPVWLRMQASESGADVLVGSRRIGTTHLRPEVWRSLSGEAERQVFADGTLVVRLQLTSDTPAHVVRLQCYVPGTRG